MAHNCGKQLRAPHVDLAPNGLTQHIQSMTFKAKRSSRARRTAEPVVVYKGIRIAPIAAKRSATSKALRDALRAKAQKAAQPVT